MKILYSVAAIALLFVSSTTDAKRVSREQQERELLYGWSQDATLIFSGTVVSVEYNDDPRKVGPHVEVLISINTLQRGLSTSNLVRVTIDDELQTYRWSDAGERIGEVGLWFTHRAQYREGGEASADLIRYLSADEMDDDAVYLAELTKYVVAGTIHKAIQPNILNLLSLDAEREVARVVFHLSFDESGSLSNLELAERSVNPMFDDHVKDTLLQIHRRVRIPGGVRNTTIAIEREKI